MKILFLSNSTWNIYNFRYDLIMSFINNGDEVSVIAPDDINLKSKIANIKTKNINLKNQNTFLDIFYIIKVTYYILKLKPDIILSYNIKPNIYSSLINYFLKRNLIVNITGLGSSIIQKGLKRRLIFFLYKLVLNNSNFIFFQNFHDRHLFLKLRIIKKNNSLVVPGSGINLNENKFIKKDNFTNTFMFIGRIIIDKGISELIEAIKIVKNYDKNINFIFLGKFDKNNPKSMNEFVFNKFIKDYGITHYEFTDNIDKFYQSADAIILPTYREGTPRVLLEAMSRGINVLCSNTIGCNHLISHNHNGIMFLKKNINDLANKIIQYKKLTNNKKLKLSVNARKFVEKNYDVNIVVDTYNKKINEILNENN